jgi:hypothetical protein
MVIRATILINGAKVQVRSEIQSAKLPMTMATIKQATDHFRQHLVYIREQQRRRVYDDEGTWVVGN